MDFVLLIVGLANTALLVFVLGLHQGVGQGRKVGMGDTASELLKGLLETKRNNTQE